MTRVTIAVVIPALNEAPHVAIAVASAWAAGADEVIVADGGSTDGTLERVAPPARVVTSARGRARQANAGWRASGADGVIFLHADSRLPAEAAERVRSAIAAGAVGGAFHKRFESSRWLLRHVRWRTRLWWAAGLFFGDQAPFAQRASLLALGGFREDVVAEDMDLALRLRRHGACRLLDAEVVTSARRLDQQGILSTWLAWWRIAIRELFRHARERRAL